MPGAHSIDISLSASDAGSASIESSFDVNTDVAVHEEITASFGRIEITDRRSISGKGEINAGQSYAGSDGYRGHASFLTTGSGHLTGFATLTPSSLRASQSISASGPYSSASMSLTNDGTASVDLQVASGSVSVSQSASTGSTHVSSNAHITGGFSSSTTAGLSFVDRLNVPYVFDSVYLYQNAQHPGTPGAFDHAIFNVNPQTKIQPSIDVALPNDEVNTGQGVFKENINIWKSLTISGAGADKTIMDGDSAGSVFRVSEDVNALLTGMTVQNGWAQNGGGIANYGTLSISDCDIKDNVAEQYGGGIYNKGTLNMQNSIVTGNTAGGSGIDLLPMGAPILPPNDDSATGMLPLGFTFTLYGQSFNQFSISNNGFLSFIAPSGSYTGQIPKGDDIPRVAPFYSDVYTYSGGDVCLAQGISSQGNPVIQIDWNYVGGYNIDPSLRDTFTLYIEKNPAGDIVLFDYKDMQWYKYNTAVGFDGGNGDYLLLGTPNTPDQLASFTNTRYMFQMDSDGKPIQVPATFGTGGGGGIYSEGAINGDPSQVHGNEAPAGTTNDIVQV